MNPQPNNNGTYSVARNQKVMIEGEYPDSLKLLLRESSRHTYLPRAGRPVPRIRRMHPAMDTGCSIWTGTSS